MPLDSFTSLLYSSLRTIRQLHQLHAQIIHRGLDQDPFLVSRLLSLSTSTPYSVSIFNRLLSPPTILFNILLKAFSIESRHRDGLSLFVRMKRAPQDDAASPDRYTYPSLIKSCSGHCRLVEGKMVHGSAIRCGFTDDVYVGSSLIDFYGKCKEILSARKVFDEMTKRNVVSWTSMIDGYINIGDLDVAKRLFNQMPEKTLASWNAMINGLTKSGDLNSARRLFDEMPERNVVSYTALIYGYANAGDMASSRALFDRAPERDVVAWSAMISGYAQNGQANEAIKIFGQMQSMNVKPDEFVMVGLMSACSQAGSLDLAKLVDCYLSRSSIDIRQVHVRAALIDMNAKCGNIERAAELFDEMPQRDLVSYCSMIQGLSVHGRVDLAVALFDKMLNEGLIPDEVAFIVILTVCVRGGLVEEGWHYFEIMKAKYSLVPTPDHYACMVDLLSRTGQLTAAYDLLKSMPVKPDVCAWGALLWACRRYGDAELGQMVANRLFELEPQNAGNYVQLSNIYAAEDRWLDVAAVRDKMKERGVRKLYGCSWI